MKFVLVPVKNQKFDIGRTINFTKCDCAKCDFMNCPKNNYALKMVQKKYSVKDFWQENKKTILKSSTLQNAFDYDTVMDFIDACVSNFPKGTYWNYNEYAFIICTQNRGKYGADFLDRAEINLLIRGFPITYFVGCTDTQENFIKKVQKKLNELQALYDAEIKLKNQKEEE